MYLAVMVPAVIFVILFKFGFQVFDQQRKVSQEYFQYAPQCFSHFYFHSLIIKAEVRK